MVHNTRGPITRAYEAKNWIALRRALRENPAYRQQCGGANLTRAIKNRDITAVKIFLEEGVSPPHLSREDQFWLDQIVSMS